MRYYIKERRNPQTGTYFVRRGQMSKTEALKVEQRTLYGSNIMHGFETKAEYEARLAELTASGERIL